MLAAIDRAITQTPRPVSDALAGTIGEHLAVSLRSGEWRQVRRHLRELEELAQLEKRRRNGLEVWALTAAGRERLARTVRDDGRLVLPDSPQLRRWRDARRRSRGRPV